MPAPSVDYEDTQASVASTTILIVEDEDMVRRLLALELEDCGFVVLQAEDRDSAARVLATHPDEIDVLLTDVVLPGASGARVSEIAEYLRPDIKTLYMSGHTEKDIVTRGVLNKGTHFINKPFNIDELTATIARVIGTRRPAQIVSRG